MNIVFVKQTRNLHFIFAFGQNLKKIRESKGLSQEELTYRADLTLSQIGRIERGEINTTINTVNRIAKALDIEIRNLFDF